jgi:hypothetical protein
VLEVTSYYREEVVAIFTIIVKSTYSKVGNISNINLEYIGSLIRYKVTSYRVIYTRVGYYSKGSRPYIYTKE